MVPLGAYGIDGLLVAAQHGRLFDDACDPRVHAAKGQWLNGFGLSGEYGPDRHTSARIMVCLLLLITIHDFKLMFVVVAEPPFIQVYRLVEVGEILQLCLCAQQGAE
jgi:hypothetical protein